MWSRSFEVRGLALALGFVVCSSPFSGVAAADVLYSSGFTNCQPNPDIRVSNADVRFDRGSGQITFNVAGTSNKEQKVKASLAVTAYGTQVYNKDFDPCDDATKVDKLCPVPSGTFSADGSQVIPAQFLSQIPSIAFSIPDVDADATLKLTAADSNDQLGCIQSSVTNGKSLNVPAVSYVAVGIAAAALILSGFSALGSAGTVGSHAPSVGFATVIGWFQSMALNGMHSVDYPPVYRSFSQNFAFSGGLIPWDQMQSTIDNFRSVTGGNLTEDNVQFLRGSTITFGSGPSNSSSIAKRGLDVADDLRLIARQVSTNVNGSQSDGGNQSSIAHYAYGIQGYVEKLTIPQANTFMTVLLIFAIVIAAITVGILLFKVILETWALFGTFPKRLTGFRQRYWRTLAKTITNLILLLYGVWTLYCIFQFTNGDSWAAKLLAGITFACFTAVLAFFTIRIWMLARRFKKMEGDVSAFYENKETWIKYSLFYDTYKRGYWWIFIPVIIYMFAKGCVLAAGNGHGLAQTAGQLIVESLMFIFLLWNRPYATKGGNWINIIIQVVRVLSVICILVFVEQLGIAQTTKTITGIILIAVQAGLTLLLAILIAINAIIICVKENPHRKQRKAAEKLNREFDNLTPLDARNSLLISPIDQRNAAGYPLAAYHNGNPYTPVPNPGSGLSHPGRRDSTDGLVGSAAGMGHGRTVSSSSRDQDFHRFGPSSTTQASFPSSGFQGRQDGRQVL